MGIFYIHFITLYCKFDASTNLCLKLCTLFICSSDSRWKQEAKDWLSTRVSESYSDIFVESEILHVKTLNKKINDNVGPESTCKMFDKFMISLIIPIIISRGAEGPGWEILQHPPSVRLSVCLSVRPSVTFSFCTVTQKRIAVFSRNFAGTCTKSWGCAV